MNEKEKITLTLRCKGDPFSEDEHITTSAFYCEIIDILFLYSDIVEELEGDERYLIPQFSGVEPRNLECLFMESILLHYSNEEYESEYTSSKYEAALLYLLQFRSNFCGLEKCLVFQKEVNGFYSGVEGGEIYMQDSLCLWDSDILFFCEHISQITSEKIEYTDYEYFSLLAQIKELYKVVKNKIEENQEPYFIWSEPGKLPKGKNKSTPKTETKEGYVYLMKSGLHEFTKIGWSVNPKIREKTLQGDDPKLYLVEKFKGIRSDESKLHKKFKKKRQRGEWFNLDASDVEKIKDYFYANATTLPA